MPRNKGKNGISSYKGQFVIHYHFTIFIRIKQKPQPDGKAGSTSDIHSVQNKGLDSLHSVCIQGKQ